MGLTSSRRRRVGIMVAVLLPLGILFQGLSQVDAQFPPKGGGIPKPPMGPIGPGFNPPGGAKAPFGGTKIVYDWRCSKCNAVIATTNTPFRPGLDSCPRCGVHFINGGKAFLNPPPDFPPNGAAGGFGPPNGAGGGVGPPNGPPGGLGPPNGPPGGFGPPNGAAGGFEPPNGPPPGGPPNGAAGDFGPAMAPPANFQPPAAAADNPVVPVAVPNTCHWCSGDVAAGSRFCTGCKFKLGGMILGGTVMVLGVVIVPLLLVGWLMIRSGAR